MYLNVTERVLEAKIAYVGPELSGKRANFATLHASAGALTGTFVDDGRTLALDVRPKGAPESDDCPVHLHLVGLRGAPSEAALEALFDDVDGVVVVVDAASSAKERNRASLATTIAALQGRDVPVVVQVNKTDAPDALGAEDLMRELDVARWPHVCARANGGEGVEETLEKVVHDVMNSMSQSSYPEASNGDDRPVPQPARGEGNPLLAALRSVLEATVERQVEELATRVERRIDARIDRLAERIDAVERASGGGATNAASVDDLNRALVELHTASAKTEQLATAVSDRVSAIEAGTEVLRRHLMTSTDELLKAARHSCSREDLAATTTVLRTDVVKDVVKAVDAAAAAGREQSTAATGALRRSVDGLTLEMKKHGSNAKEFATLSSKLDGLENRAEKLSEIVVEQRAPLDSLQKSQKAVEASSREVREQVTGRLAVLERAVRENADRQGAVMGAEGERSARVEALLVELIEELKKPKKGWFG